MHTVTQFFHHIINTPSVQTDMQARLLSGESLEAVTLATAKSLGYAFTFADISAVLDENPALADKLMALIPAPMLELDEAHLEMIAGGNSMTYTDKPDADNTTMS